MRRSARDFAPPLATTKNEKMKPKAKTNGGNPDFLGNQHWQQPTCGPVGLDKQGPASVGMAVVLVVP
jgi:hypothetical protein